MIVSKYYIEKLRVLLHEFKIDAIFLTLSDEFFNEFVPENLNRIKRFTGFTGSNANVVLTADEALFLTDSRYTLQAQQEVSNEWMICDITEEKFNRFKTIGYVGKSTSISTYESLQGEVDLADSVDEILCMNDISFSYTKPYVLDRAYVGMSSQHKIAALFDGLDNAIEHYLICSPESACFILNIRAADLKYTPALLCYAVVSRDGEVCIFTDSDKAGSLPFSVKRMSNIEAYLGSLDGKIAYNKSKTPITMKKFLEEEYADAGVLSMLQAVKTDVELGHIRHAHVVDGVAVTKFLHWLEKAIYKGELITEYQAARQLLKFREEYDAFKMPSFESISSYGANGAIIHYSPSQDTAEYIRSDSLYLIDSGGQYYGEYQGERVCGTTDVTRTVCFGEPTEEQKRHFTYVLKAHVYIASSWHAAGESGIHIDKSARDKMGGLSYGHGTGHGVGYFLGVHEGPHAISMWNSVPLVAGMLISNEPGYYVEGQYGIRIENIICVREKTGGIEFDTITYVPIQSKMIDFSMLTEQERVWVEEYNQRVYEKLSAYLTAEENAWLSAHSGCI